MAENNQVSLIGTSDKPLPGSKLTTNLDKLQNTGVNYGTIMKIHAYTPDNTVLEIKEAHGYIYTFTGQEAFFAVTSQYGAVQRYQDVHFFAKNGSKEVLALLMQTIDYGWALIRSDKDLCKLELKQHSTRLMLVIEFEECQAWESGYKAFSPHVLPWLVQILKRGVFSNELCCSLALWGAQCLGLRKQSR